MSAANAFQAGVAVERVAGADVRITRTDGAPLVLLTRMASGESGIWDAVWPGLARKHTVANVDLAALADLDAAMAPRERFLRLAEACLEVVRGLGFERYRQFGWYGGCHVALAAMLAHGDRLERALLLDPFHELPDMRAIEAGIAFKRAIYETDRELYARYWVMAGFSSRFLAESFDTVERLAKARAAKDRLVGGSVEAWMGWVRALRAGWLTREELASLDVPTRIVSTELDAWHAGPTPAMGEALATALPDASFGVLPGVGTFVFTEAPERFWDAAGAFLAEPDG